MGPKLCASSYLVERVSRGVGVPVPDLVARWREAIWLVAMAVFDHETAETKETRQRRAGGWVITPPGVLSIALPLSLVLISQWWIADTLADLSDLGTTWGRANGHEMRWTIGSSVISSSGRRMCARKGVYSAGNVVFVSYSSAVV